MKEDKKYTARIGMVNFINTAPFYEVWRRSVHRPEWHVTEAPPTKLNEMLYHGELDLGFISSHEYGAHPELYKILGGLSISATGPVGSVFLFSREKAADLQGKKVLLSAQSQTSVALVKIILEEFYGVQPIYEQGAVNLAEVSREYAAVLAIGDDALRLKEQGNYPVQMDLSEVWHQQTGLPFVFAVWAVREEFCQYDPVTVVEIHHELQRCIQEGRDDLLQICELVAPRIPMEVTACHTYLQGMEYDLGPQKVEALERFFELLVQRGEMTASSLPLKICE
ncbi:MAG: menaquinone biosynthesis protein [Thermodesulfobacteriota bacterium]